MEPITWIVIILAVAVVGYLILTFNSLISIKTKAQNAREDINIQLKRRYETIPNIIETVKGVAKQERELFAQVSEARAGLMKGSLQDKMDSNNQLNETLKSLFAVAEAYPEMKSNTAFENLQKVIEDTQDKIMYAERLYNALVRAFPKAQ